MVSPGNLRLLQFFLLFFIFIVSVSASEIKLIDYVGNEIEEGVAFVDIIVGENITPYTLQVINGSIVIDIPSEEVYVEIYLDLQETIAKDYHAKISVNEQTEEIQLQQIGFLRGAVIDQLKNVVDGAELKFECTAEGDFPETTDRFGSFSIDNVPIGTCKIHAMYKGAAGDKIVNIQRGSITDIDIVLDKSILSYNKRGYVNYTVGAVVLILLLAVLIFFLGKNRKQSQKKTETVKKEESLSKKTEAIMPTLNKKERQIVEFLLENKHHSTQRLLYRSIDIPRTSLSRIIEGLERKKILKVEKIGKMKKIKLTDWFLGKE